METVPTNDQNVIIDTNSSIKIYLNYLHNVSMMERYKYVQREKYLRLGTDTQGTPNKGYLNLNILLFRSMHT